MMYMYAKNMKWTVLIDSTYLSKIQYWNEINSPRCPLALQLDYLFLKILSLEWYLNIKKIIINRKSDLNILIIPRDKISKAERVDR